MAMGNLRRGSRILLVVVLSSLFISSPFLGQSQTTMTQGGGGGGGAGAQPKPATGLARLTKVLIARTVSSTELANVVADARRIDSHRDPDAAARLLAASASRCGLLRNATANATAAARIDPFENRSGTFPNRVLCDDRAALGGNHYLSVRADFLLFARDGEVARRAAALVLPLEGSVAVADVSERAVKIWNWILFLTDAEVEGYDYVWMVDGDIELRSLNWHAFWQQVLLVRPRVSQPCVIGTWKGSHGSGHPILNHNPDPRMLAAETAIVELQAPLFEVDTWRGYRGFVARQTREGLLNWIEQGGEDCFDLAWCHYARANMTGEQLWPPKKHFSFDPNAPAYSPGDNSTDPFGGHRSCVVFYQTPVVHLNKRSLGKGRAFRQGGREICLFFKRNYHIHWAVRSVYEVFVASP